MPPTSSSARPLAVLFAEAGFVPRSARQRVGRSVSALALETRLDSLRWRHGHSETARVLVFVHPSTVLAAATRNGRC